MSRCASRRSWCILDCVTGTRRSRPRTRAVYRLVVVLRLLALVLVSHASGVVHDVQDFISVIATGADAPHDDDVAGDCNECPAGCPNCHCSHSVGSLPQAGQSWVISVRDECTDVIGVSTESQLHSMSDPRSVYRPPRSTARPS